MSRNKKFKMKLSVVLATLNEEENIATCIGSVKSIADEIVVVDEGSTDNTREIAKKLGARVFKVKHEPIFHKTKQKALPRASLVKIWKEFLQQIPSKFRRSLILYKPFVYVTLSE